MGSRGSDRTPPDTSPNRRSGRSDHQLDRWQEYGSTFGSPQARRYRPNAACDRPDSRIGDVQRLINPGGFDKADAPSAWPAFQKFRRTMGADSPSAGRLTRFWRRISRQLHSAASVAGPVAKFLFPATQTRAAVTPS